MRRFVLLAWIVLCVGCHDRSATYQFFYGTNPEPVRAISIGTVEAVEAINANDRLPSSVIQPNRLAVVRTIKVVLGHLPEDRFNLAFESVRKNAPVANLTYVFFWDDNMRCIEMLPVKGENFVKDGREVPLETLLHGNARPE